MRPLSTILSAKAVLAGLACLSVVAAACKKEAVITEPPPHRLVGSWRIDTISANVSGVPITIVPASSDLTLNADHTGRMAFAGTQGGFADTVTITDWATIGTTVIFFTRDSQNDVDTIAYERRIDEQNTQRWTTPAPERVTLRLTRK